MEAANVHGNFLFLGDFAPISRSELGSLDMALPEVGSSRSCFTRCVMDVKAASMPGGWTLVPCEGTDPSASMTYKVLNADRMVVGVIEWSSSLGVSVRFLPEIVWDGEDNLKVSRLYALRVGLLSSEEIAGWLRKRLEKVGAFRVRSDGRVWWLPPSAVSRLSSLFTVLRGAGVPIYLPLVESSYVRSIRLVVGPVLLSRVASMLDGDGMGEAPSPRKLAIWKVQQERLVALVHEVFISLTSLCFATEEPLAVDDLSRSHALVSEFIISRSHEEQSLLTSPLPPITGIPLPPPLVRLDVDGMPCVKGIPLP